MVQALPTVEISVCDNKSVDRSASSPSNSSNKIGYIYTIDNKYDNELEQKTNKYIHSFLKQQNLILIISQTIIMIRKRKGVNQMRS